MRDLTPPFRFDLRSLISCAKRKVVSSVDGVSINLPFIAFNVKPDDLERRTAREVVIRMAERRVLNASECCDNCIDQALESLQKIRSLLVDKQVKLSDHTDGALYLILEMMGDAIRQFLTFEQSLAQQPPKSPIITPTSADFHRPLDQREQYFAALEMLRAHLYRCLIQISKIANMEIPKINKFIKYDETWQIEAYVRSPLPQ